MPTKSSFSTMFMKKKHIKIKPESTRGQGGEGGKNKAGGGRLCLGGFLYLVFQSLNVRNDQPLEGNS